MTSTLFVVSGRRLVVPALLGLSGLGWAAVHALAHRAVMSEAAMPHHPMAGYASYQTTSLALCLALALSLAAGVLVGRRWRGTSLRSLWLFGLVPVLGFVAHASGEPALSGTGAAPSVSALTSVVLAGLLIQIPFALVAVGLARHVLWLAESLARALTAPPRSPVPAPAATHAPRGATHAPAFRLDLSYTERGPPLLAA
jgi:hypothetical protein